MNAPLLQIDGLTTTFPGEAGRAPVVDDLSLEVQPAEVVALVGESGCGKSMTAMSVLRLVPRPGQIEKGAVRILGRDVMALSIPEMRKIRGAEISMIFQEPMTSLNPVFQAGEQVVEAIRLHEKVSHSDARTRTLELFRRVGIPDPEARLSAYPHQLSGGIRQRVMIAMALATRPRLLIADEPTTALDVTIQAQILELLLELRESLGMAVLLITHDLGVVNELAHRVSVMYAGKIVERGTREQVLGAANHPYTRGLLGSMPGLAARGTRLHEIPGVVPSPDQWPPGCRFSTRCPLAFEPCSKQVPTASTLSEPHTVWCHAVKTERAS